MHLNRVLWTWDLCLSNPTAGVKQQDPSRTHGNSSRTRGTWQRSASVSFVLRFIQRFQVIWIKHNTMNNKMCCYRTTTGLSVVKSYHPARAGLHTSCLCSFFSSSCSSKIKGQFLIHLSSSHSFWALRESFLMEVMETEPTAPLFVQKYVQFYLTLIWSFNCLSLQMFLSVFAGGSLSGELHKKNNYSNWY